MTHAFSLQLQHQTGDFTLDVNFEVGAGITALFGPSGAGKTMVLDCLAGLRNPRAGHIRAGETLFLDTSSGISLAPERRGIGYVFQHGRLFPHLTVSENLTYGARWRGGEDGPALQDVIKTLGIENLLDRRPNDLSGGEQQRVAIGRAFLSRPKLLLMDEPLSALDTPRRLEILPFIEALAERFQIPVLYVSHNADEVLRLADDVVLMDAGQIRDQGPVDQVFNDRAHFTFLGRADASGEASTLGTLLNAKLVEHDLPFKLSRVHGQGLSLWIQRLERPIGSKVRLRLNASDIAISRAEPHESSILNSFEAEIIEISPSTSGQVHVGLQVAGGFILWAQITSRSATRLNLQAGDKVWGAIKSVAVVTGAAHSVN